MCVGEATGQRCIQAALARIRTRSHTIAVVQINLDPISFNVAQCACVCVCVEEMFRKRRGERGTVTDRFAPRSVALTSHLSKGNHSLV